MYTLFVLPANTPFSPIKKCTFLVSTNLYGVCSVSYFLAVPFMVYPTTLEKF